MDLQKLIAKMDEIEAKGINEAGDPAEYARAQQQMDRLEKAAKYTGDDEIVRGRMGLPPKLPPIEQWDGKMPQPVGKPDWFSRLTTMGGSTDAQAQAVAVNQADNATNDEYKASITKAKDLIAKIKAALSAPAAAPAAAPATTESLSFKSNIARQLSESFGYNLKEGAEEAKPLMAELGKIVQGFGATEDPEMLDIAQQYSELQSAMNKPAGTAPGQTATPTPGGPSSQDLTGAAGAAGEAVGKKLQRFKELLAKATGKPAAPATAAAPVTNAATLKAAQDKAAGGAANPLAADPITANAKPKAEARLSEAEKYAALRDRLLTIEARDDEQDQQVDEFLGGLAKGVMNVGKNFAGGLKGAATTGGRTATGQFAKASGAAKMANTAGKTIAKRPVTTAVAAGGIGAAAGYGLSGNKSAETPPVDTATPNPKIPPKKPTTPTTPTTPAAPYTPEETAELDMLAREFGDSEDPEIAALLKQYSDVKNSALK